MKKIPKPVSTAAQLIVLILVILFVAQSARVRERVDLTYAMTSLVFPGPESFSSETSTMLFRWIEGQRERLGSDRTWSIGPRRQAIDAALARLDECEQKLKDASNNQMQNTGTSAPDSDL